MRGTPAESSTVVRPCKRLPVPQHVTAAGDPSSTVGGDTDHSLQDVHAVPCGRLVQECDEAPTLDLVALVHLSFLHGQITLIPRPPVRATRCTQTGD